MYSEKRNNCAWIKRSKYSDNFSIKLSFVIRDEFMESISLQKSIERCLLYQPQKTKDRYVNLDDLREDYDVKDLCKYYRSVLNAEKKFKIKMSHNDTPYFWMRLKIENEHCDIHFPWYDWYSEINAFLSTALDFSEKTFWSDIEQGWGVDIFVKNDNAYFRYYNCDTKEEYCVMHFNLQKLKDEIRQIKTSIEKVIMRMTKICGWNYWEHNPFVYSGSTFSIKNPIKLMCSKWSIPFRFAKPLRYIGNILNIHQLFNLKIALFSNKQEKFAECEILKITFSDLYISVPELIMYPNFGECSYDAILYYIIIESKRLNYKSVYMIIKNKKSFSNLFNKQNNEYINFFKTQGWQIISDNKGYLLKY
jgi:biotin operon repressor